MDEHKDKTPTDSSELLLSERWDLKMQKDLFGTIHGKEYDGGDLYTLHKTILFLYRS